MKRKSNDESWQKKRHFEDDKKREINRLGCVVRRKDAIITVLEGYVRRMRNRERRIVDSMNMEECM